MFNRFKQVDTTPDSVGEDQGFPFFRNETKGGRHQLGLTWDMGHKVVLGKGGLFPINEGY